MCRQVLGISRGARAIALTPRDSSLRPSRRRIATARVTAGTCRTWVAPRGDLTRGSAVERPAVVDALIVEVLSIYNYTIILTMTRSHGPMARPKEGNEGHGAPDRLHELRGRSPSLLVGRPLGAVRRRPSGVQSRPRARGSPRRSRARGRTGGPRGRPRRGHDV